MERINRETVMQSPQPQPMNSRILVVDDNPDHLRTLGATLESEGAQPLLCQTGREALTACEQHAVHVVVLNLRLPDMDGLQLLDALLRSRPRLKVIVHAGYATRDTAMTAVKHGAFAYVQKEGKVEELLAHIHRAFHLYLAEYSATLQHAVEQSTWALMRTNDDLRNEIAERKQTAAALRESEARFRHLLEDSMQGIVIYRDNTILFVNQAVAEMFGYDTPEAIYRLESLSTLIAPHERERLGLYRETRLAGEAVPRHYEFQGVRRDGSLVWLELQACVMMWEGELATQVTVVDITKHKHLEEQLRQSQKMEAMGTLAGGIAHEFNNILSAILGFTDLTLYEVPQGSQAWANMQEVLKATRRAKELVQQILAFSRPGDRAWEPLVVASIVREALALLRATLPATIAIHQHLDDTSGTVLANRTQLHQVVLNLCTNAAHAMRDTGGLLEISVDTVEVDRAFAMRSPPLYPGSHVRLRVRDTGPGMPPEVVARIFEPFFTTKEIGEGTGMGLAIVHGIVTSANGAITVQSTPGEGTTFTIYLPQSTAVDARKPLDSPYEEVPRGHGRILFVDDEVMLARLGYGLLTRLGYEVEVHTSSRAALDAFRADPGRFDLVMVDQTMPHMTGASLAKELRRIRLDIPIILCTGFSHVMNAEKAQDLGIDAFLMKPLATRDLAVAIQHVFQQRSAQETPVEPLA
jgi:PAS domain S-box-containing protein